MCALPTRGVCMAPATDGPVIGGAYAISAAPPAPPPPNAKGPGAGNLSGFVLIIAICAGIVAKLAQKALKHRPSAAMREAQKKAHEMAAELRNAAQQDKGSTPNKDKAKSKRSPGSKRSDAKFTQLQTDEDGPAVDVEACGEEDEEAQEPNAAPSFAPASTSEDVEDKNKAKKKAKKKKGEKLKRTADPAGGDEVDAGDAVSGICFGAPVAAACRAPAVTDSASAVTCDFGSVHEPSPSSRTDKDSDLHVEDEMEGEGDDEDDITPNDSVSNIGYSRRHLQSAPARKPQRQRQRAAEPGGSLAAEMPKIVEQLSAEQEADLIELAQGIDTSPTKSQRSADSFMRLGDLDSSMYQQLRRPTGNEDAFSAVHEEHLAMRNRIPGDEMRIDLVPAESSGQRAPTKKSSKPAPKGAKKSSKAAPVAHIEYAHSDASFNSDEPQGHGRARAPPLPMPDDESGSDVGSAVTFNFAFDQQSARQPKKRGSRVPPPPQMLPEEDDRSSPKSDSRSDVTFNFGMDAACDDSRDGVDANKQRRNAKQDAPARGKTKVRASKDQAAASTRPVREPRAAPRADPTVRAGAESAEEERGDMDDDAFTSVGLSSGPSDPYLRGGRLMGGGVVSGPDGKWQAQGQVAHPSHLRYGDRI